ncbi:MAG: hypothetical protein FWE60_00195, partial [Oscillospiraceae bacterium]|nr:hypothetical protein [Oscillospiraceae bacterium]
FDTKKLSVFELLTLANYKTTDIMGRSGRALNFTVNGKRRIIKGGSFTPSEVTVNGNSASLNTNVTQGDRIGFKPAVNGESAVVTLREVMEEFGVFESLDTDVKILVNGEMKPAEYEINSFDKIEIGTEPVGEGSTLPSGEPAQITGTPITVTLNGSAVTLPPTEDGLPNQFLELLNFADYDLTSPIAGYTLLLNGREASFNDPVHDGDEAVIEVQKAAV